jgi:PEP-CTERM motif
LSQERGVMNLVIRVLLWAVIPIGLALGGPSFADPGDGSDLFQVIPPAGVNYKAVAGPVACPGGMCRTSLEPPRVVSLGALGRSNTRNLSIDLGAQRPGFTVDDFGGSLNLNFKVTSFTAFNNGKVGGAQLLIRFTPQPGTVLPANLHWVQVVTSNDNINGINGTDLMAPEGQGNQQNSIDAPFDATSPYYDVSFFKKFKPHTSAPPAFQDRAKRDEPNAAHPVTVWNADLFLVSDPGGGKMILYNAVEWGWVSEFSANGVFGAIPEPAAWAVMLAGFGLVGVTLRRRRSLEAA